MTLVVLYFGKFQLDRRHLSLCLKKRGRIHFMLLCFIAVKICSLAWSAWRESRLNKFRTEEEGERETKRGREERKREKIKLSCHCAF